MKRNLPILFVLAALGVAGLALFGDRSYANLQSLRGSVERQRERNGHQRDNISELKREVIGLHSDDRTIEKAARNQLGMARPDELVLIFDDAAKAKESR